MRTRATIETALETDDGGGGATVTWTALATVWARVRVLSGRERLHGGRLGAELSHRVVMRHRADVSARERLVIDGRVLNIRAVIEHDRRWLELLCDEGVGT